MTQLAIDNQNKTALTYNGNWATENDHQIPSLAAPKPYMETHDFLASVSLSFTNSVAVAINGNLNYGHWTYKVVSQPVSGQLSQCSPPGNT